MKALKRVIALVSACCLSVSLFTMPVVNADESPIANIEVNVAVRKNGEKTFADYDNVTPLKTGDRIRVRYEYTGPATNELKETKTGYNDDGDEYTYEELVGGTSIVGIDWNLNFLDSSYFTVVTKAISGTGYLAADNSKWTVTNLDDAEKLGMALAKPKVIEGIYSNTGRIAQIMYDVKKDLDKDFVVGALSDFDYRFVIATADNTGAETGKQVASSDNKTLSFGNVTLKGATAQKDPTITLKPDEVVMLVGNTAELSATTENFEGTVEWTSSKEDVATVKNGVVKAVGLGTATITATASTATATCTITVRAAVKGDEIKSTDGTKSIKVLDIPTVNFANHGQFIYITKGDETKKSEKSIGEILGGEWVEGTSVEGTIAVGILTADSADAFSFEIK